MLTFIHTYTKDSFDGLIKNGLFRAGDGLKLMHKSYMPPPYDFNHIAAVGGSLYDLLSELRCPFYIDRLQGGVGLPYRYDFSPDLVRAYKELLGDNFLGWQMHEWASNLRSDRNRIREKYRETGADISDDKKTALWDKVISGEEELFLEAMTRKEWAEYPLPQNRSQLLSAIYRLYRMRCAETGNMLIPADSYYMAPAIEISFGARLLLPEVGWQIPNMRLQLAYYRGMAEAAGIRWGIYYECWCYTSGVGLTIPFSLRRGQDEWIEDQLHTGTGADQAPEKREKGGTSRNLQARAWRFAYLSGASVIAEEYGVCNTFRDYDGFELSEYGQTKKDFLDFTQKLPDIGTPYRPAALVLPSSNKLPILETTPNPDYLECPSSDQSFPAPPELMERLSLVFTASFGEAGSYGNNSHVMTNGGMPDVLDIIHADNISAFDRYKYLIDLSGGEITKTHRDKILTVDELRRRIGEDIPCTTEAKIHMLFNRISGGWIVSLFNNDGILCDSFDGDRQLHEADIVFDLLLKNDLKTEIIDGRGVFSRTERKCRVGLEAGQWLIIRLTQ